MSRQDERERVRRRLGELTARVGASRTAGAGTGTAGPDAEPGPSGWETARSPRAEPSRNTGQSGSANPARAAAATHRGGRSGMAVLPPLATESSSPAADHGSKTSRAARVDGSGPVAVKGRPVARDVGAVVASRATGSQQGEDELGSAHDSGVAGGAARGRDPQPDESSGDAGKWDLLRLSGAPAPDRETEDDVGRIRSPGWLEEPTGGPHWRRRLVPERFRGLRLDPGTRGVRALALVGIAAMVVAGVIVFRERPIARPVPPLAFGQAAASATPGAPVPVSAVRESPRRAEPSPPTAELVVSVVGLVQRTGLVRLPEGSRVADALAAAGGPSAGADTTGLNLAQRLSDGDQVLVGPVAPSSGAAQQGSSTIGAGGRPSSGSAAAPSRPSSPAGRIDLNTASESELDALPGVGPVTARAIVGWRTTNGRFTSVEQLGEVDGIGPARLARLRDLVRV
ncbi:ComEA family DNA-binding protein [Nocardia sp. NPDC019219]|uniref:ComEA family DNA-binding protein n=1 Tax=Nocardia sp. NPDC019219 TaxID=3154590 RepID=UPI0033D2AEF0